MKLVSAATAGFLCTVSLLAVMTAPAVSAPPDGRFEVAQAQQQLTPEQRKAIQERKAKQGQQAPKPERPQGVKKPQAEKPPQANKTQVKKFEPKAGPKVVKPNQPTDPKPAAKTETPNVQQKETAAPKRLRKPAEKTTTTTPPPPPVVKGTTTTPPPVVKGNTTTPPTDGMAAKRGKKQLTAPEGNKFNKLQPKPTAQPTTKATATPIVVQKGAYKQVNVNKNVTVNNFVKVDQIKVNRQVKVENGVKIISEPGNRTIIRDSNNRVFIRHNDTTRFGLFGSNLRTVARPNGLNVTTVVRPGGAKIISVFDARGNLVERRRWWNGQNVRLIDNRRFWGPRAKIALGVGVGLGIAALTVALAPPVFALPRERYIVDYEHSSPDLLFETLSAPPVERLERRYSLDEIRYSHSLRERVRRVDLDGINFDFGSWEVTPDQYGKLERLAKVILRVLEKNPNAMIMIEGYTDAVGEAEDNLSLSDRRAESVATILTREFEVPPENLVTQGYGEQFLKVETQGPERANRRVTIRNVTELMAQGEVKGRGGDDGDGGDDDGPGDGPEEGPGPGEGRGRQ